MILSEQYLEEMLGKALELVPAPADYAVVLEGSLAEGFGNEASDLDFLLIAAGEERFSGLPTVLFIAGRKVDVRVRSSAEVRADVERLRELQREQRPLPASLLNRCQRLGGALTLKPQPLLEDLRAELELARLPAAIAEHSEHESIKALRLAGAMRSLHQTRLASAWAHTANVHAVKARLARVGETYMEPRWLSQQLARSNGHILPEPEPEIDTHKLPPDSVVLARAAGVTSWRIGASTHVVRDQRDVFVLDNTAAALWRTLVFGKPVTRILAAGELNTAAAGALLASFHSLGLVRLRVRGGALIHAPPPTTLSPSARRPFISLAGTTADAPISLLPIPAERFAAAGMALAWGTMMVASTRRDLAGAVAGEQWQVFDVLATRMARRVCLVLLSAYGVHPLPPPEHAYQCLCAIAGLDRDLVRAIGALERGQPAHNSQQAARVLRELDATVTRMHAIAASQPPPAGGGGRGGESDLWRETVSGLNDWARICAYLDAPFPDEDLRDLLAADGRDAC